MRIWVRPDRLKTLGLTVADLSNAVKQQNVLLPAGQIGGPPAPPPKGTEFTYVVRTKGRLLDADEFGQIVVRSNPDGSQVRLKDVARIDLGSVLYNSAGRLDGKPAAVIAVYQAPGLQRAGRLRGRQEDRRRAGHALPTGSEAPDHPRHHAGHHRRDRGDPQHAARGGAAGHPGGLRLPAELAGHAHPAAHRAGVPHRDVHDLPAARLLGEHAVAARPGAGHRHRGRRRHRGGRGGHAPHRAGHDPARRRPTRP